MGEVLDAASQATASAAGAAVAAAAEAATFLGALRCADATPLSDADYEHLASTLHCDANVLKAVAEVESGHNAFAADGRPIIAYERHRFYAFTDGKFGVDDEISNPQRGNYTTDQSKSWDRLARAYALDKEAALKSVSWGRFQLMGENYAGCGYSSVEDYVKDLSKSEQGQFAGFEKFIHMKPPLLAAIQQKNWREIAHYYNGAGNIDDYAPKLEKAYTKLSPHV